MRGRRDVIISCAIAIATLAAYLPVRNAEFLRWDDQHYVTDNPQVRTGLSGEGVLWAVTTQAPPYWHPLTWLSHMADVELFGLNASRHHLVNVFIHAFNALLLFALLRVMTGTLWRSAFVAAVFALHPLHVESVAWVAERKDVLSTFFLFLSMLAYVRYARQPSVSRYALVVVTFGAALMSKPMVVTYPFVLVLLDIWPLCRPLSRRVILEKLPLLAMALAVTAVTVVIQDGVGAVASATTFPWGLRIANAAVSLVAYGQQTFWPAGLAAFYPWNWSPAPHVVAGAALLLLATSAGALIARRRRPYLMVGWAWFLLTVLPVIGLIQSGEQSRGDRFMYVPLVGLAIAVAWGIESLLTSRTRRIAAACVSAGVLTACAATTYRQSGYWQNDVTLWERALAVTEGNYLAHDLLGVALEHRGDYAEALAQYSEALRLAPAREPDFAGVVEGNIGRTLLRQGKPSEAQAHLDAAVRLYPSSAEIRYDRGEMLLALRQYPAAASEFRAALAANHPRPSEVQNNLGLALFNTGRLDDALSAFVAAVQTDSSNARAENGIGLSLSALGQDADALTHYDAAIRLRPDFARAHANLGMALQRLHRSPEALNALLEAVRLDPSQPAWHFSAAVLLAQSGRLDEAREHFERVIALEPDSELGRRAQAALR